MLVLTEADVRSATDLSAAIDQVAAALVDHSAGRTDTPLRAEIRIPDRGVLGLFMPSHVPDARAFGCKVIAEFPANADRGLPVLTGSLTLLDYETGLVDTLMGATYLTNMRTGALTAAAARVLAPEGTRTAAVIGSGGLATLQALALAEVVDLDEIRVWGRRRERAEAVAERIRMAGPASGPRITVTDTARAAVDGAEVVVTATSAHEPVIEDAWIEGPTLLCAVGSNAPTMQELPTTLVAGARLVVVDSRAGVVPRSGDITIPVEEGVLDPDSIRELGEVLPEAPARPTGDERVVFKSCGFAALDVALAAQVRDRAVSLGLGSQVDLGQSDA